MGCGASKVKNGTVQIAHDKDINDGAVKISDAWFKKLEPVAAEPEAGVGKSETDTAEPDTTPKGEPDTAAKDPQLIAISALMDDFLGLPQWQKIVSNGFSKSDKDKSGQIDARELEITMEAIQKGVLGSLFLNNAEQDVDQAAVQEVMSKYNKDSDAELDKEEFTLFATEYIRLTVYNSSEKYLKEGHDLKPVIDRLELKIKQMSKK